MNGKDDSEVAERLNSNSAMWLNAKWDFVFQELREEHRDETSPGTLISIYFIDIDDIIPIIRISK